MPSEFVRKKEKNEIVFYTIVICLFLTLAVVLSVFINIKNAEKFVFNTAYSQARAIYEMEQSYRGQEIEHERLYIPGEVITPHIHRQIAVIDGSKVIKINPLPDSELEDTILRQALKGITSGHFYTAAEIIEDEGRLYMQYVAPIHVTEDCLTCHMNDGYTFGEIKGGVAVTVPLQAHMSELFSGPGVLYVTHILVWLMVTGSLLFATIRLVNNMKRRSTAESELLKFNDMLEGIVEERIHDAKEAKDIAEKANRAKSDFLANVGHEVRTPLNGIMGMADLLRRTNLDDNQKKMVDTVTGAGQELLEVLNAILDFSKAEAGRMVLECEEFNLVEKMKAPLDKSREVAKRKGLKFITDVDPDFPEYLYGDADKLCQVIQNLIVNAVKFTETGTVVYTVKVIKKTDKDVTFRVIVEDTGIGISQSKQDEIFTAFEQEDSSVTRRYGGMGLGLAICAHLIQLLNSQIHMESELNKGSRFWLDVTMTYAAPPSVDMDILHELTGGDSVILRKTIELFVQNAPVLADKMRNAIESGDNTALQAAANTLKSYLSYFTKGGIYNLCVRLENIGQEKELPAKRESARDILEGKLIPGLEHLIQEVKAKL